MFKKLNEFLRQLDEGDIFYKLERSSDECIMVEIVVPGERWDVEFSEDEIRVEKYISSGVFEESELEVLFRDYADEEDFDQ